MSSKAAISFEYFPPKTDAGRDKLLGETTAALQSAQPSYYSVTYGAGGSTRDNTRGTVLALREQGLDVAPHLSFGLDGEDTILGLLKDYQQAGINRLVALRGDLPSGTGGGTRLVYANELVAFIREHTGDHFHIEVAAYPEIHPQAESYESDIGYLKGKFDAGADSAITQYFYNVEAYFYFLDRCAALGFFWRGAGEKLFTTEFLIFKLTVGFPVLPPPLLYDFSTILKATSFIQSFATIR